MQPKVKNLQNYFEYIKCGEILKSPSKSYQCQYVLKCFQCKEIYLLFEAFIFHIEDHCKDAIETNEPCPNNIESENINQSVNTTINEQMACEAGIGNLAIKLEEVNNALQTEDPLIVVKSECTSDHELSLVKEETKQSSNTVDISNDIVERSRPIDIERNYETGDDSMENYKRNAETDSDCSLEEISDGSMSEDEIVKKSQNVWAYTKRYSIFINDFMKSKENVTALIAAYKNQPSLWNKNFPTLRHKLKRQHYLQQIADELKNQHNLNITWNQAASLIIFLCRKYREDLRGVKEKEGEEGSNDFAPSWFFEELTFLKPFMENNLIAKLDSHMPELLPNQIIQILDIYKGFPHLWNTHLIEYYCKNKRHAAKQEMIQLMETNLGITISEHILEDYFRTIHNCFTRAKRTKSNKILTAKDENNGFEDKKQQDYYEHMIFLYDHVGAFKCSECQRTFKSPLYLRIHKTQHHGSEPLTCSLCNKEFKTANSYTNHAKRHMKDLNHVCKECGKKFLHSTDLRIHMRNHTGAKPFCCEICGASFRHIQGFSNHRRRHEKNYLHTCHICSKGYYSKDRYNDHMNAHSNIRSQICNVCGKAFITKRSLQQHVVIHEDVRRHACKLCGKTFKHKTGVNQHMRTHGIANSEEKSTVNNE